MIRTVLAIVIGLGVTAAIAQEDPIKARKALMKTNGQQAKVLGDMAKGDAPFDLAAAQKAFGRVPECGIENGCDLSGQLQGGRSVRRFQCRSKGLGRHG